MTNLTFGQIYADVPSEYVNRLKVFRQKHPYKSLLYDGVKWKYIATKKEGTPLLVLGGGLSTGESAFTLIEDLMDDFRVISPSYPAVGNMASLYEGLMTMLDAEGINRVSLYGQSMGAAVAHVFVRMYPQRVDKVVLSGFGLYNRKNQFLSKTAFSLFRVMPFSFTQNIYLKRIPRLLDSLDEGKRRFLIAYFKDLLLLQHTKASLIGQFELLEDLLRNPVKNHVFDAVPQDFQSPKRVLIFQAKDDSGFAPDEQQALRDTYPNHTFHQFASGGHLAVSIHREEFIQVLREFLKA
ncbi:MAG TPA: alpha/beta hydrolase [Anaerolineae bacterium]|nr:alpha/beta hydrolase [Anaerolineae bacterium]